MHAGTLGFRGLCLTVMLCMLAITDAALAAPDTLTPHIKVDQFGYQPGMRKLAIVVDPQAGSNAAESFAPGTSANQYQVRRWADDSVIYSGTLAAWRNGLTHAQSGDRGWVFDFSAVTTPDAYYIHDAARGVSSGRFEIAAGSYDQLLRTAVRVFFYQRLNHAKQEPHADSRWVDDAAYEGPAQDRYATSRHAKGDPATARDVHGGWMDAGDTNKYTTFAQDAVLALIDAWRFNPAVFTDDFGIPESGNGTPDLLDELRWELDFLKRMQDATGTGGFLLKVGSDNYNDVTPPSTDPRPRYYVPECTSATLSGAAMLAAGAVALREVPEQEAYAADLLTRAEAAWTRATSTTANFSAFQTDCDDGDIKAGDADRSAASQRQSALIAAIYLFEATAKPAYNAWIEIHHGTVQPLSDGWWGPYNHPLQVALLRYAGMSGATPAIATLIRNQKASQDDVMSLDDYQSGTDLYRAYLPDPQYHWGHNMARANAANMNLDFDSFGVNPANAPLYRDVAHQHLHWLHGANPLGLVMLSNMNGLGAERSLNEIYHVWFADGSRWDNAETSAAGPAPGYVSGGPNRNYSGPVPGITDQPPQKAYKDWNTGWPENSWELSEPAIYSQAAYVQLLARSMAQVPTGGDISPPSTPTQLGLVPGSVSQTGAQLEWQPALDNVGVTEYTVVDALGGAVARTPGTSLTLDTLFCGSSQNFSVRARDAAGNESAASNTITVTTLACPTSNTVLFADALGAGWSDWSWSATRSFTNSSPVKSGTRSVRVDLAAWGALSLRHATGIALSSRSTLTLWAYAPSRTPLRISVQRTDTGAELGQLQVTVPARKWTSITLSRSQMGNPNLVKRVNLQLNSATPATVYFDQMQLTR